MRGYGSSNASPSEKPWSHWKQRSLRRNPELDELDVIKQMDPPVLRSSPR